MKNHSIKGFKAGALVVGVVLAFGLAGCGSSNNGDTDGSSTTSGAGTAPRSATPNPNAHAPQSQKGGFLPTPPMRRN